MIELNINRRHKLFVEFEVITQGENEFEPDGRARGWLDIFAIESFYETTDGCMIIMTEIGDCFKVDNTPEFLLGLMNDVRRDTASA